MIDFSLSLSPKLIPLFSFLLVSVVVLSSLTKKESATGTTLTERSWLWEPEVRAEAYLVKIFGKEKQILSQRSQKRLAPASLTKLMTALIAAEMLPESAEISIDETARIPRETGEKLSDAKPGEKFGLHEILKLLLVGSANDAARALAQGLGEEKFVALMNERAKNLGLGDTHFSNPEGLDLDAKNHFTSAEDLAKFSEYLWRNYPGLWEITKNSRVSITSSNGREYTLLNTNELLREFPEILGGKTGFTDKARGTLLLLYPVKPDNLAVIAILGSEDRSGDGRKIIEWLETIKIDHL